MRHEAGMTPITLAYGRSGLEIELPEKQTLVVQPVFAAAADDQRLEVLRALREPVAGSALRDILRPGATVAISMCDGTRPQPRHIVIPAVLEAWRASSGSKTWSSSSPPGPIAATLPTRSARWWATRSRTLSRIVNHDARDDASLVYLGRHGQRRAGVAQHDVGRGRHPHHDRVRRAALLRRVQRRTQAGRSRSGRAGDRARRSTTPPRIGDPHATWGVLRGQPRARRRPRRRRGCRRRRLRARRCPQPGAADRQGLRRPGAGDARSSAAADRESWRCDPSRRCSTSSSPPSRGSRSTRTCTSR